MNTRSLQFGSLSGVDYSTNYPQSCAVVTPPSGTVMSIEAAKVWLRNDRVDYDNPDIELMIKGVTEQLERTASIDFLKRTRIAEWVRPRNRIYLPYGKHGAITLVNGFDADGTATPITDYVVYGLTFKWIELNQAVHRVQVTFESGYDRADMPAAFDGAVRHELTLSMNYRSGNPTARTVQGGMSIEARQLLLPYMRRL